MWQRNIPRRFRLEFAPLVLGLGPNWVNDAWVQFNESLLGNSESPKSYAGHFRALERFRRANARRDRYNWKRKVRRTLASGESLPPLGLLEMALLGVLGNDGLVSLDPVQRALHFYGTDVRHLRRLAREARLMEAWLLRPVNPAEIPAEPSVSTEVEAEFVGREVFLELLLPTPVPALDVDYTEHFQKDNVKQNRDANEHSQAAAACS